MVICLMSEITFITGNPGKFKEALVEMPSLKQADVDLLEIQHLDPREVMKHKFEEARKLGYEEFVIEDTSLIFECLGNLPGPLIKWFLKDLGTEGLAKEAELHGNNRARAITWVGYMAKDGNIHFFEGMVKGKIMSPRGEGFGWDPIFQPEGSDKTFGEMSPEEKSEFSMRKIAFEKLKDYLVASSS